MRASRSLRNDFQIRSFLFFVSLKLVIFIKHKIAIIRNNPPEIYRTVGFKTFLVPIKANKLMAIEK
jgi:hypothetical protein